MKKIMLCLGLAECVFGGVDNYVIAMEKEEYKESSKTEGAFIDENQAKEIEKKLGKNFQLRKIEQKSERGSKKYVDFFGSNRRVIGLYTSRGNDDDRFGTFLQLIASMLGLDRLCLMPNDEAVRPDKFLYSYENGEDSWQKSNNITNLMFLGLLSEVIAKGDEGSIEALTCFCGPNGVLWEAYFFSESITLAAYTHEEFGNAYNLLLKEMIWDNCNNCNSYNFSIVKECLPIFLIQNLLYTDDIAYETLSSAVNKGIFAIPSKAGEEEKDPLSNTVNQLIRDKYGPLLDAVDSGNLDEVKKWLSGYILFGLIGSGNLEDVKFFMESVTDDNEFLKKTDDDEFLKKLFNIFNDEETTADNIIEAEFGSIEDEEIRAWEIENNKRKIAIDVKLKNDLLRRAKQEFVNEILWKASTSKQYSEAARFLAGFGLRLNETVLKKLKKNKADIAARVLFGGFCLGRIPKIEDAIDKNLLLECGYHKKEIDAIKNGQLMDARIKFITDLFYNPVERKLKKEKYFLSARFRPEKATRTFARENFFTNVEEILIGCGVSRDSYLFEEMMKMARNRNLRQDFERSTKKARKIAETMALNAQLVDVMIGSTAVMPDDIILDPLTVIKDSLEAGADVFLKNNDGKTAFDIATSCEYGEAPLLLLLNDIINKGLDLSPERIDTVLRNAVSFGYMDAVSLILGYVAERGITLPNGMVDMVLKKAESLGRTDVVDFIIDRGFLDNTNNPIYRSLLERLRREQAQNRAKLKRERAQNQAALSREQAQNQAALRMISNVLQNMVRRMGNLQNSNL